LVGAETNDLTLLSIHGLKFQVNLQTFCLPWSDPPCKEACRLCSVAGYVTSQPLFGPSFHSSTSSWPALIWWPVHFVCSTLDCCRYVSVLHALVALKEFVFSGDAGKDKSVVESLSTCTCLYWLKKIINYIGMSDM
jgi:hypothetical protein